MLYLEWIDKQKTCREKLIVCGILRQFLSGSVANPVSMLSHVHPFLTKERAGGRSGGQEDTAQQGRRTINGFGQDTGQWDGLCMHHMCACVLVFHP